VIRHFEVTLEASDSSVPKVTSEDEKITYAWKSVVVLTIGPVEVDGESYIMCCTDDNILERTRKEEKSRKPLSTRELWR